jgi:hypothetical protein
MLHTSLRLGVLTLMMRLSLRSFTLHCEAHTLRPRTRGDEEKCLESLFGECSLSVPSMMSFS